MSTTKKYAVSGCGWDCSYCGRDNELPSTRCPGCGAPDRTEYRHIPSQCEATERQIASRTRQWIE